MISWNGRPTIQRKATAPAVAAVYQATV